MFLINKAFFKNQVNRGNKKYNETKNCKLTDFIKKFVMTDKLNKA